MIDGLKSGETYRSPDARKWAVEFCRVAALRGFNPLDPKDIEWVATWITSAMMRGRDGVHPNSFATLSE